MIDFRTPAARPPFILRSTAEGVWVEHFLEGENSWTSVRSAAKRWHSAAEIISFIREYREALPAEITIDPAYS
jgi:hypothetical protein